MTEAENAKMQVLSQRVEALVKGYEALKEENRVLKRALEVQTLGAHQAENKFAEIQESYENLKVVAGMASTKEEAVAARLRIWKLVRKIDTCIALLNRQ